MNKNNKKYDRRPTRLKTHDYSVSGYYFITTCVLGHKCVFGYIRNGKIIHNEYGKIAIDQLHWLAECYDFVKIRTFMVMPNHVHIILELLPDNGRRTSLSLSQLVGAYKTKSSTLIRKQGLKSFSWQRSFYDHVIIHPKSYENIIAYIQTNSMNWKRDRFYRHD